MLPLNNVFLSL